MVESPEQIGGTVMGARTAGAVKPILQARSLGVHAGARELLRGVTLSILPRQITGIIGPSGAGKSTLLKCLNRLIELTPGLRVSGEVLFHESSIFGADVDIDSLRARIGILFQQPVIFPKSIFQNVIFGTRHLGKVPRKGWPEVAERALREAALWDEVRDRLHESALRLSVGQQQRLCLARTLAVDPEVILMDEPTSSLDIKSAEAIEELIRRLKLQRTIVLVTHNLEQARRVTDFVACLAARNGPSQIIKSGPSAEILGATHAGEIAEFFRQV